MHDALKGRRVFVTGGARGLGAAFVTSLAEAGAHVAFGDVLEAEGRALAEALQEAGHTTYFVPLDLADPASVKACVAMCADKLGGTRWPHQQRGDHELGRQVRR